MVRGAIPVLEYGRKSAIIEIVWNSVDAERHSTPGNGCGDGADAAEAR